MTARPQTLYEKIWNAHVVERRDDGTCLIYIDRHLVHEVTSPQAFEGLRAAGRAVRRPDLTLAVPDHNLPTTPRVDAAGHAIPIADPESANQLETLRHNVAEFGVPYIDALAAAQGIVHAAARRPPAPRRRERCAADPMRFDSKLRAFGRWRHQYLSA